jgi:hypothetical protein
MRLARGTLLATHLRSNANSEVHTNSAKAPLHYTEHLVAWPELRYVSANRFSLAGYINT